MDLLLNRVSGFFISNIPSWKALALGGPLGLLWSLAALWWAGWLQRNGTRTGYTRKVFHFVIFSTVAALEWRLGTPAVCLFAGMCTMAVFFALLTAHGLVQWVEGRRLRDLVSMAFGSALLLLTFAELSGWLVLAFALLAVDQALTPSTHAQREATLLLGLLPFVYAACLWLLGNWLIMGDAFYFLRSIFRPGLRGGGSAAAPAAALMRTQHLAPALLALAAAARPTEQAAEPA